MSYQSHYYFIVILNITDLAVYKTRLQRLPWLELKLNFNLKLQK